MGGLVDGPKVKSVPTIFFWYYRLKPFQPGLHFELQHIHISLLQISRAVLKYHQEQKSKEVKAEKEESVRLRKIAASISKEIKQFWSSVEKVTVCVCYVSCLFASPSCLIINSRKDEGRGKYLQQWWSCAHVSCQ